MPDLSLESAKAHFLKAVGGFPPALTAGLTVFLTLIYIINWVYDLNDHLALHADSLFKFDLNRISLYPLGHLSLIHLVFNLFALITPLARFERSHGTVYTGVILNLFAVFAAIPYCIVSYFLLPNVSVIGASGWVFSFLSYMAFEESRIKPTIQITPRHHFPTLFTPAISLILIALIVPGSSFLGHFFGMMVGYTYAFGYMNKLVPPSKIIEWIEGKVDKLIELIPTQFTYYREVDAKHVRTQSEYVSIFQAPESVVSASGETTTTTTTNAFQGPGHVLGSTV